MSLGEDTLGLLLREEFPHYTIIPQHTIRYNNRVLFLDFYLPQIAMAFEMDGRQHTQYVAHYHKDELGFEDSQYRDALKDQWCIENGIHLIRFAHTEDLTIDTLRKKIKALAP